MNLGTLVDRSVGKVPTRRCRESGVAQRKNVYSKLNWGQNEGKILPCVLSFEQDMRWLCILERQ